MRTRRRRPNRLLVAVLTALCLTGCGSTVSTTGTVAASGSGLDAAPGQAGADGLSGPVGSGGSIGPGGGSQAGIAGGSAMPGPASPESGAAPGSTGSSTGNNGAGLTTTKLPPIELGTYYLDGGTDALAAQGVGLDIPDNKPLFDAMVRYLNGHGGLAGRQIRPVYYKYVYGGDPQAQDAAACAQFTEDNHVYLVIGGINSGAGQLADCLTKHGVPLIGANAGGDARYFAKNHRYVYEPGQANFTTGLSSLVADLARNGFFSKGSSVGLVQYEGPVYDNAVADGLIPALAKLGLTLKDRARVTCCDNTVIASGSANAQLKFSTEGINRVIFMAPGGAVANAFMQSASSQGYKPQYGVWSADSPFVLAIVAPKDQLAAATGIGYQPGLDVAGAQDPTASTPAAKACLAFWSSIGQSDQSGLNSALKRASCDIFYTLLRAVRVADATTSTAALEAGYDAIGGSYTPAATFATKFVAGSHDASNGYRRLVYQADCSCFTYVGQTKPIR
jgi:hypothetical protein